MKLFTKFDELNLRQEELVIKAQPKVLIHGNLTETQLLESIKAKLIEAGISVEQPDQPRLE